MVFSVQGCNWIPYASVSQLLYNEEGESLARDYLQLEGASGQNSTGGKGSLTKSMGEKVAALYLSFPVSEKKAGTQFGKCQEV